MRTVEKLFIKRRSLGYKLLLAFALMSVVPLLVVAYFVSTYVFPSASDDTIRMTAIFIMFALWISWTGYMMAKKIVLPVIDLALEAKIIADGQYDTKLTVKEEDELGEIAGAVNSMTDKMRAYLGQLQKYSEETASLNVKIHRKVLTLTNLMELGDIISSGAKFEEVAGFAAEKMAGEIYGGFSMVLVREETKKYYLRSFTDRSGKNIDSKTLVTEMPDLEKLLIANNYLLVDSAHVKEKWQRQMREKFDKVNMAMFPMKIKGNIVGVVILGNLGSDEQFSNEDIELLRAFGKEILLGYQSSQVIEKVKSLEVVDSLTGLYTFSYLEDRLEDEINRAVFYQRPCSLLLVDIDGFKEYSKKVGSSRAKKTLKDVGDVLSTIVPAVGKVARAEKDEFAMLLPEKNKRESLEIAEEVRKKIEELGITSGGEEKITVSVGVGENPIDGATAKEVIKKAREYVAKAKDEGRNKVVGW